MNKLQISLGIALLATSALIAPRAAFAQADAAAPPAAGEVDEIVVMGRFIPDVMRETSQVATILGAEDLQRQGDSTAAGALRRLTGLSVVGNKFVYVRGLGERYSSALLNGSPLPSPEPLQRVVPLDLFPSNVLSGTTVQKTYSPAFPGEFGGGVIDLQTIALPNEPFVSMGVSGGYNSRTTQKDGLVYYGSETDWLGYDNGARDVPAPLQAAFDNRKRVNEANFGPGQLMEIGHSFVNAPLNLLQRNQDINPDVGVDISAGRSFDMSWGSFGIVAVAGFDNAWRTREGVQQEGLVQGQNIEVRTDYDFTSTQNDVVVNGLFGAGVDTGEHEVKWTNLYVHSTTKEARSRQGNDELAGAQVRDDYTEWFERQLLNTQLTGDHDFDTVGFKWRAAYAETSREAPYEKGIRYRLVNGTYLHNASQEQNYTRFSRLDDELVSGGADLTYRLNIGGGREALLTAGGAYSNNIRYSEAREFRFLALNNALPAAIQRQRVDYLLADYNIRPDVLSIRETTGAEGAAAYKAALRVSGGYVNADAEILPAVRASAGVRFEDATQSVRPLDLFGGVAPAAPAPLDNSYWLPAGTLTWEFADNMQLRLGASKTLARPQFRELAPQQYLDPDSDRLFIGNPYLVDSELLNLDARLEWYFANQQFFTVSGFYKDIDRPVEAIVNEAGATVQQTYINAPRATLYGAEFEVKKVFEPFAASGFLGDIRWLVQLNYTYSKSEVKVATGDLVFPLAGQGVSRPATDYVRNGARLQGQSKHLANAQLGIENDVTDTQATLLVGYGSDRISARGRPGQPDLIQRPGVIVDFTFRQGLAMLGRDFRLGFEARNLLDEDYIEFQALGTGTVYNNRYGVGRSFSVSLSTAF